MTVAFDGPRCLPMHGRSLLIVSSSLRHIGRCLPKLRHYLPWHRRRKGATIQITFSVASRHRIARRFVASAADRLQIDQCIRETSGDVRRSSPAPAALLPGSLSPNTPNAKFRLVSSPSPPPISRPGQKLHGGDPRKPTPPKKMLHTNLAIVWPQRKGALGGVYFSVSER